ncbi:MAG: hypothetical protein OYK82_13185 [Gammaproteobacteria bacterium]|nr:hypothetical protein [Gammaproteobacteria bacterium]
MTEQTFRDKKLHRFQRAFVPDLPSYWSHDAGSARREMKLRNYTVAGRFDWIESEFGSVDADEWLWIMGPGAAHLVATLPPPYADDAFSAGFDLAGVTAAPGALVLEAYTVGHVDRAPYAANASYLRLLRGEAEEVLAVFAALPGYKRESRAARTGLAATRAAVATLRGDDAGSLRLSVKSAADWFGVSGELEVNAERAVELRNLFELIDSSPSSRFVPPGDGAFVSLTKGFRRQLEDLSSVAATPGKKLVRVHPLAALTLREFFESARLPADAEWEARRRRFEEAGAAEPRVPGTLRAELRPYQ